MQLYTLVYDETEGRFVPTAAGDQPHPLGNHLHLKDDRVVGAVVYAVNPFGAERVAEEMTEKHYEDAEWWARRQQEEYEQELEDAFNNSRFNC